MEAELIAINECDNSIAVIIRYMLCFVICD